MRQISFTVLYICTSFTYAQQQITALHNETIEASSSPINFFVYENQLLFVANTQATGSELWRTDGTEQGTTMVKDINLGPLSSVTANFLPFKGKVYFTANDLINGQQLWVTDGTASGTNQVTNTIGYGVNNLTTVNNLATDGNFIYFLRTQFNALELWKSDGTSPGTTVIKGEIPVWNTPANLSVAGGLIYFSCQPFGVNQTRVWRSDGTEAGTFPVTGELNGTGSAPGGGAHPTQFVEFNGDMYFVVKGGPFPYPQSVGLMKSDGTPEGTVPVKGFHDGSRIHYGEAIKHNSKMYFAFFDADYYRFFILESDGTAANTTIIFDQSYANYFSPSQIVAEGDTFYFTIGNSSHGTSLVKFNLNDHSVDVLGQVADRIERPFIFNSTYDVNRLIKAGPNIFVQSHIGGFGIAELWVSDGTGSGTVKLDNSPTVSSITAFKDNIYFNGVSDEGYELWVSDGGPSGTKLLKDINIGSYGLNASKLVSNNSIALFVGRESISGNEPWITDGTAAGTRMLKDIVTGTTGSNPDILIGLNDTFVFAASDQYGRRQFYKTDGTDEGTIPITGFADNKSLTKAIKSSDGRHFYFAATHADQTRSLFISDGTASGTEELKNFGRNIYGVGFQIDHMVVAGEHLFFTIVAEGEDLWKSDGTASGTVKVADLFEISELVAVNNNVYFTVFVDWTTREMEVYKSDGTIDGTGIVKNLNGTASSEPFGLTAFGDKLVFSAVDNDAGREVWISDGTEAGTHLLKDIFPGPESSVYRPQFAVLDEHIYFSANNGTDGSELWKSDGTPGNTAMLKDLSPGPAHGKPEGFVNIDGKLYFKAYTPEYGYELWSTDGTLQNTNLLVDVMPGPQYSNPSNFVVVNEMLVFYANTAIDGVQLWSYGGSITGTEESKASALTIFPNPSSGTFKIHLGNNALTDADIDIVNIQGRRIHVGRLNGDGSVNLQDSPPGVYIVRIRASGKDFTRKIVKF